jgi:hypothetical protein
MSIEGLKREPHESFERKAFTELPDGSVIANRKVEIYLPKRFVDNGMATVSDKVTTAAVLGLVIPGESYAPLIALMDITLVPLNIRESNVNGIQYLVLEFEKGDTVIESLEVIQDPNKPYHFMLEFYYYAKIPWYMGEQEVRGLFDNAKAECGNDVGSTFQVPRVLTSIMFRDPDNPDQPYRYSKAAKEGRPPLIVGLNNGSMLIDGTFAKISSGYLQDNTLAAMVNPDTKVTDYERIMRGIPT